MGNQQSILERVADEKRASAGSGSSASEDDDYVHVDTVNEKQPRDLADLRTRTPEGLWVHRLVDEQSKILAQPKNRLALAALSSANPRSVLKSATTKVNDQHIFNTAIPFEGAPITNQRSSGRCWLFASTNTFRVALMQRHRLAEFELSQSYLFFWDKLEKSNWFLEQIIDTAVEPLDGRLVQHLLGDIVSDGGQWDMVYNLVDKYGLVPQVLYPDSFNAKATGVLNSILKTKLREYAVQLRALCSSAETGARGSAIGKADLARLRSAKTAMMHEVQTILTLTLGAPPDPQEPFTWQFRDRDGKAQQLTTTPAAFARDIYSADFRVSATGIASMLSLVHDPRHEPLTKLTVPRLGNVVGGRAIGYINVDMTILKNACVAMLRAGMPVFFGSDVGKFSDSGAGIMDLNLYDYELGFNVGLLDGTDKATRLRTGESQMTHAMVLTAVHIDHEKGAYVRWRVQNSWGADVGDKGWFVMSDAWMDEFVYQAVVDPRFVPKEVRDVMSKKQIELPIWDPMGSLA
ncbi:bleomycin hydrolase [Ceratocystis pirilliformis]|uniref:Cysteine proteinase 1, mitochondrial n=1 Tax=Ceratocystis pirilliformis TaxID=259994 RepID=A0ABR3YJ80_9PEZI